MHVDHLIFASRPEGLKATVEALSDAFGERFKDGGFHPRFGTRNHILPLTGGRYVEAVEVLDHPAAEKAVFGQAVRARMEAGGGWLGWVVSVDDLAPYEQRLERQAVPGSRHFPDGRLLEWEQIGVRGTMADPQLPFFLKWTSPVDVRPSALPAEITLSQIDISGSRPRVEEWLGTEIGDSFDEVGINFTAPNGMPGIDSVVFDVPGRGEVRI